MYRRELLDCPGGCPLSEYYCKHSPKEIRKFFEQAVAQINVVTVNLVELYLHYRRCRKISLQAGADKYNFGYIKCSNIMIRSASKCGLQESC